MTADSMKKTIATILLLVTCTCLRSQVNPTDTLKTLDSVKLRAFGIDKLSSAVCIPVAVVDPEKFAQSKSSLLTALNTVPGVRMEERSPGSYRISIRGSSLRSPFGVRNIKVYWNDIAITDPGGNTYFNQFAANNFTFLEVVKGPAASMYGAGTGGLILLNSFGVWRPGVTAEINGGSYGTLNIFGSLSWGDKEHKNMITGSRQQSDGYRDHTVMHRDNFSWSGSFKSGRHSQTDFSLLYTNLYYQAPGALTFTEYKNNPRASRPAAGGFPSARNAKAAIFQQNLLAGVTEKISFSNYVKNTTTVYGYYTDFKNPAVRNYEQRKEPSWGGRTNFNIKLYRHRHTLDINAGAELQTGLFNTQVSKNKNGERDTLQTNDDIKTITSGIYAQISYTYNNHLNFFAGASTNYTKVTIKRLSNYPVVAQTKNYQAEIAPRFGIMKDWDNHYYFFVSVSRGFSPPTTAELLPSTGVISTNLEAEEGWSYESGFRGYFIKRALHIELTGFSFKLQHALVPRRDNSGADYFVNAGDMTQRGLEFHADYTKQPGSGFFKQFFVSSDLSMNHFRYGSFIKDGSDFSGNKTPSVPAFTASLQLNIDYAKGFYSNAGYYHAAKIYLNDANTAVADPYAILNLKAGWKKKMKKGITLNLYAGVENLLGETYSLGNDINAAAGRYYNAAAGRSFYAGVSFNWRNK